MATRSSVHVFDGTQWHGIYVHFDGYPTGVGATLLKLAPDLESALKIVSGGYASSIAGAKTIEDIRYYAQRSKWDPKSEDESNCETRVSDTLEESLNAVAESYNYAFKDGRWFYEGGDHEGFFDLAWVLMIRDYILGLVPAEQLDS